MLPDRGNDADAVDLDRLAGEGRPSAVHILQVDVDLAQLATGWTPGPLPVRQPVNDSTRELRQLPVTDEVARRTLVDVQQANALYGHEGFTRRHLYLDDRTIVALEMLAETRPPAKSPGIAFLVVHGVVPGAGDRVEDQLSWLAAARVGAPENEFWMRALAFAGTGVCGTKGARPRSMSFLQLDLSAQSIEPLVAAYAMLTGARPADLTKLAPRAHRHTLTVDRPDWGALILRDGGAYVAHGSGAEAFGPTLRTLIHSVHADALLYALIQRAMIDRSGERAVRIPLDRPDDLVALESDHFEFRRKYWRTSLTDKRTAPPDEVLHKLQEELLTVADVHDVKDRVGDGARLATSINLARQKSAQDRLNRIVQNGSVVIGSFGLVFTAAPVIADPSWALFLLSAVVGLVAVLSAFGFLQLTGRRAGIARQRELH